MTAQKQPAITADNVGEAVGKIAAFAALSLHESFPNLDLDELVETFTRESATGFLAKLFLAGLDQGKTAGEAAGAAGSALIRAWAEARNAARAQLDAATA
jgi:Na+/H+-translocating membrane pyrophosphatase